MKASRLTISVPPFGRSRRFVFSAAGFIATSTFGSVAGREDVVVGEVELEAGDARQRAGRRADLGREVGQRREVVPDERGLAREPPTGELHPVAGVAGEPDRHLLELLDLFCHSPVGIAPRRWRLTRARFPQVPRSHQRRVRLRVWS